ncbi:TRAP transporter small permease [Acuticoccus sp. I52.16.1]|uniref:TRAP transporter small permease n=1 Tax=Acuticoccus sp. I52.16.1 TaxID=2928472 RepID=UPI001FD2F131|nr:TRAP transporter small permease subunit [Acuticoccus sp. I52.16.1]UOM36581.1 TRAP transporter small permease subunit [Acuticoccus sp. I52.16.1]
MDDGGFAPEDWLLFALLSGIVGLSAASVVARYALPGVNIAYLDILLPDLFVWLALVAAAAGVRHGAHLGLTLLHDCAPPVFKRLLDWFYVLAGILFFGVVLWTGWELTAAQMRRGTMSAFGYPAWIVTAALPVASAIALARFLGVMRKLLKAS